MPRPTLQESPPHRGAGVGRIENCGQRGHARRGEIDHGFIDDGADAGTGVGTRQRESADTVTDRARHGPTLLKRHLTICATPCIVSGMTHGEGGSRRPSNTRAIVVVFAITLAVLQYIDRVAISQAAPLVMDDLGLTKPQMGWVFSAFTLAYALFEIPGGYLGDWIGPRKVLLRIVLWWSFFTAATGWAWNLASLMTTRFLFGAGEAGCFPNLNKALKCWLPAEEWSRAQGIMWMSARWGGAITPLLVYACLMVMTWRQAFLFFGVLGVVWAIVFAWWYRDDPRTHPGVNAAEAALLPPPPPPGGDHLHVPWRKIATSRTVWCLCGQYAAMS